MSWPKHRIIVWVGLGLSVIVRVGLGLWINVRGGLGLWIIVRVGQGLWIIVLVDLKSVDQCKSGPRSVDQYMSWPRSVDQCMSWTRSVDQCMSWPRSVDHCISWPRSVDQWKSWGSWLIQMRVYNKFDWGVAKVQLQGGIRPGRRYIKCINEDYWYPPRLSFVLESSPLDKTHHNIECKTYTGCLWHQFSIILLGWKVGSGKNQLEGKILLGRKVGSSINQLEGKVGGGKIGFSLSIWHSFCWKSPNTYYIWMYLLGWAALFYNELLGDETSNWRPCCIPTARIRLKKCAINYQTKRYKILKKKF